MPSAQTRVRDHAGGLFHPPALFSKLILSPFNEERPVFRFMLQVKFEQNRGAIRGNDVFIPSLGLCPAILKQWTDQFYGAKVQTSTIKEQAKLVEIETYPSYLSLGSAGCMCLKTSRINTWLLKDCGKSLADLYR